MPFLDRKDGRYDVTKQGQNRPMTVAVRRFAVNLIVLLLTPCVAAASGDLCLRPGTGPGQVGLRAEPEANPEGPAAAVVREKRLYLLDRVNRRIQVLAAGKVVALIPRVHETDQAFAILPNGHLALLDHLVRREVRILAADGTPLASLPLAGAQIGDPAAALALRVVTHPRWAGLWLELATANGGRRAVRLADLAGRPMTPVIGIPTGFSEDGRTLLDYRLGQDKIELIRYPEERLSTAEFRTIELTGVMLIHGAWHDESGRLWLVARIAMGQRLHDELLVLSPAGKQLHSRTLPASQGQYEIEHPLALDEEGHIHWLYHRQGGHLCIRRVAFRRR